MLRKIVRNIGNMFREAAASFRKNLIYGLTVERSCKIYARTRIRATDGGKILFGEGVVVERNSEITASPGNIRIGRNTFIGQGSIIVSKESICIGNDCLIAEYVTIRDQNHVARRGRITNQSGYVTDAISIGNNVWLGAQTIVLSGVKIGDGCVIGAGSVVNKDMPPHSLGVGSPVRIVRRLEE